jgi:hypothetical protein
MLHVCCFLLLLVGVVDCRCRSSVILVCESHCTLYVIVIAFTLTTGREELKKRRKNVKVL